MTNKVSSYNLNKIIDEIDNLVLRHDHDKNNNFPTTESELIPNNLSVNIDEHKDIIENVDKGHYRGISFGINPNQDCAAISKNNDNTLSIDKYIKVLEENNEVLKQSNCVLINIIREKDDNLNSLKQTNEALSNKNVSYIH